MAIVYGQSGAEKELISSCNLNVNSLKKYDSEVVSLEEQLVKKRAKFYKKFDDMKRRLKERETKFFEGLGDRIEKEKEDLESFKKKKKTLQQKWKRHINSTIKDKEKVVKDWDKEIRSNKQKIKKTKKEITKKKKLLKVVPLAFKYINLSRKERVLKPSAIRVADRKIRSSKAEPRYIKQVNNEIKDTLKEIQLLEKKPSVVFRDEEEELIEEINEISASPETVFKEEHNDIISELMELNDLKDSPHYFGAIGELTVLKELMKLDDNFHILCDRNIELDDWRAYKGKGWNLKSAQMDFVVVSPKGVFVIEVKNWSDDYLSNHYGITPHEQLDRANRVLYVHLKNNSSINPQRKVKQILIPIQRNIGNNSRYPYTNIKYIDNLNYFLIKQPNRLSQEEINAVIRCLED